MRRDKIERLMKRIQKEGSEIVDVLGIEPFGVPWGGLSRHNFFVKCMYKKNGLPFVVKSLEQWEERRKPPV